MINLSKIEGKQDVIQQSKFYYINIKYVFFSPPIKVIKHKLQNRS
ncbi:MAG: hypothetical protein K0S93_2246 [Nitrososphaeraceae archaeon]|jgi:hypothetical protein|nr:hypothetical protein [Nitrososphaeraceae archaeon]